MFPEVSKMLRELGCRLSLPPEVGKRHCKGAKVFLQRPRLSTQGRENHEGLPRFWLRWFETANKCKTTINRLCGGCSVGLELSNSLQVHDTVALGIALSNPNGLGNEIWKWLGFFSHGNDSWASCTVGERFVGSVVHDGYHSRA